MFKDLKTQQVLLQGPCSEGLYPIHTTTSSSLKSALAATSTTSHLWHYRLDHPHSRTLNFISQCNPSLHIAKHYISCKSCKEAKGHKLAFEISENRQKMLLALIHSDVWGLAPVVYVQDYNYYVIFVDDYSRFTWIYPMRKKSEVTHIFIQFKTYIEKILLIISKYLVSMAGQNT
ncbi:hypothetical protein KFK09_024808 [Dendrobium nobile]|uniref:GAG-pre-integrase domain-containing protein n=1 Tax=Dendrobium nobile TaxID=94219 RepID=A0A8T3ADL9_DENNO|nr:hypothetical protein KFK09_024808 [Dendrobium nobile]